MKQCNSQIQFSQNSWPTWNLKTLYFPPVLSSKCPQSQTFKFTSKQHHSGHVFSQNVDSFFQGTSTCIFFSCRLLTPESVLWTETLHPPLHQHSGGLTSFCDVSPVWELTVNASDIHVIFFLETSCLFLSVVSLPAFSPEATGSYWLNNWIPNKPTSPWKHQFTTRPCSLRKCSATLWDASCEAATVDSTVQLLLYLGVSEIEIEREMPLSFSFFPPKTGRGGVWGSVLAFLLWQRAEEGC